MGASFIQNAEKALTRFLILAGNTNDFPDLGVISPKVNATSAVALVEAGTLFIKIMLFC